MLNEVIRNRRSVRIYTDEIVKDEHIKEIIEAGMWAPTACNKQDYQFIYLDNKKSIVELYNLGSAHFLKNCSQAILVLYYNDIDNVEYHDDILSAGMIIQNMLLKASELNVGSCVIANLPSKGKMRKHFSIPRSYDPIALISLGHVKKEPRLVKRQYEYNEVVSINKFDAALSKRGSKSPFKMFIKRTLRRIYIRLPRTKFIVKIAANFEKKFDN